MIPKVINYCWFGGAEKPNLLKRCIESWKKFCPDYEIKEWNESNFDVNICEYTRKAVADKNWGFLVDYARLNIIYNNGGIYLDTDIMLRNNLDELLSYDCFLACSDIHHVNTGSGFGAVKNNGLIYTIMSAYDTFEYPSGVNTQRETPVIEKALPSWKKTFHSVTIDNILIIGYYSYPKYAIHLYTGAWKDKTPEEMKERVDSVEQGTDFSKIEIGESRLKQFESNVKWAIACLLRCELAKKIFLAPPSKTLYLKKYIPL